MLRKILLTCLIFSFPLSGIAEPKKSAAKNKQVTSKPAAKQQKKPQSNTNFVKRYKNWILQTHGTGKNRMCYLLSQPKNSLPKNVKRGDIYLLITRKKSGKSFKDEVSFVAGYPFKKDSDVTCTIDKNKPYKLFTNNDRAWAPDDATDKSLVTALKKGNQVILKGMSSRGTLTTDTISLLGLTEAYKALIQEAGRT